MSDGHPQVEADEHQKSLIGRFIRLCLTNKLAVGLAVLVIVGAGLMVAPFEWDIPLPRAPVPVDAVPDIGANQQIVFTAWPGQSPREIDDQISYPLSTALLGIPKVKTIRSSSMFGFSSIYVIFEDGVDFWWARSRLSEKLNSLPAGTLPPDVRPRLGPEATALGQVFWYTLEGRDEHGRPAGKWDLEELRTIQDWTVRDHLAGAGGVAEVASVGGFVREYQVDVDPDAMRIHKVTIGQVYRAVRASNLDVGARTIEVNNVEYIIRGKGYIRRPEDIANSVVKVTDNVPILVKHVATVGLGPAQRRGALDKDGAEAVGGVVVANFGTNPLEVINNVKRKIDEIAPSLPRKVLPDGTVSQVTIVPFYDRTGLIRETLNTLRRALTDEILITIVVVVLMVSHLRSSILIGSMLPLAVLMCFIAMKLFGVDANIVALSGIAIAIGTIVDMGIVICENILRRLDEAPPDAPRLEVIHRAASEVGGAVVTAVMTTIVGFLPVFAMTGERGKLFRPLAFTKTFAIVAAVVVALAVIPPAAHILFCGRISGKRLRQAIHAVVAVVGVLAGFLLSWWAGLILILFAAYHLLEEKVPARFRRYAPHASTALAVLFVGVLLTRHWRPLGPQRHMASNLVFVALIVGVLLVLFRLFRHVYPRVLRWCLCHKAMFLSIPVLIVVLAVTIWFGFETIAEPIRAAATGAGLSDRFVKSRNIWVAGTRTFPGLGREEMPALDEGSFLWMPSMSSHGSMTAALGYMSKQNEAFRAIPEVESVVGKIGRVRSALDPAPIGMIETVINYKSEYLSDSEGRWKRQWRGHIAGPDDIWREIVKAGKLVGVSSAPKLQPIATRRIMLQTGLRSKMGLKIKGRSLEEVEDVGIQVEHLLKQVPSVDAGTVQADRIVASPYIVIDTTTDDARQAMGRYNLNRKDLLEVVEAAMGGKWATTTVEGRKRFPVRVRYQRELWQDVDSLPAIIIPTPSGAQVPLGELATIRYEPGPRSIKREGSFQVGYVIFGDKGGLGEVDVIQQCRRFLDEKIKSGELKLPEGTSLEFMVAGKSVQQYTAEQAYLYMVLVLALLAIFMILYFQFRSAVTTMLVFSGIFVAWSGGFLLIWLYGQGWFLNFSIFGVNMRSLFQVHPINLSVAVWVGFLALFGIATDDGVIQSTYLNQAFRDRRPTTVSAIRDTTVQAAMRRVRPCLMTSATTILALIPVLTSTGRGSDIMVPMAIPSFGGMLVVLMSILVVPVLYCLVRELKHRYGAAGRDANVT